MSRQKTAITNAVKQTVLGRPGKAGASAAGPVAQGSALGEESATSRIACARGRHVLALMIRLKTVTINAVDQTVYGRAGEAGAFAAKPAAQGKYSEAENASTLIRSARGPLAMALLKILKVAILNAASQTVCGKAGKGGVSAANHVEQDKDPEADLASTLILPAREPVVAGLHKTLKYATPDAVKQTACGRAGEGGVPAACPAGQHPDPGAESVYTLIPSVGAAIVMALVRTMKDATTKTVQVQQEHQQLLQHQNLY